MGASTHQAVVHIEETAPGLTADSIASEMWCRTLPSGSTTWTDWRLIGNVTDPDGVSVVNDAPIGAQVRVNLEYPHEILVTGLFSRLLGDGSGTIPLRSSRIVRRE